MAEDINVVSEIRDQLDRRPFHSFTIVMASGDRYEVTDRHSVAIGRSSIVIVRVGAKSITLRQSEVTAVEAHEVI